MLSEHGESLSDFSLTLCATEAEILCTHISFN